MLFFAVQFISSSSKDKKQFCCLVSLSRHLVLDRQERWENKMGNGQSSDQNKINQYLRERNEARGERDQARWERDQAQASGWRMDISLVVLCSGLSFTGYIISISSLASHILLAGLSIGVFSSLNVILIVMFTPALILLIYYCNVTLISVITNTLLTILLIVYGNRVYVNIQRFKREREQAKESSDMEIEQAKCVVCLVSPREVLLRPCRHVCGCQECINR